MTTLGSTGQIKDPVFPEEPERNNAREQSLIKRGQICWNGQSSQVCYLLRREFADKRRGIVCCHGSSPLFRGWHSTISWSSSWFTLLPTHPAANDGDAGRTHPRIQ